jgi:hypothetical protein
VPMFVWVHVKYEGTPKFSCKHGLSRIVPREIQILLIEDFFKRQIATVVEYC